MRDDGFGNRPRAVRGGSRPRLEPPRGAPAPSGALAPAFVLNVYKEVSWTSHDAVGRVRRILDLKQVGHAGSLDPLAAGVLLVAVGRATKVVSHLMALPKSYRGTLRFGRRTTTGDGGGEMVAEGPVPQAGLEALQAAAARFHGTVLQVPPMVSALKQDGERLYDLARRGIEVDRAPRPVRIDRFTITGVDLPRVDFELDCGRGTYVRTLAEDLAAEFGTVAFVESLVRTRVGKFSIEDSCRLISPPGSERAGLSQLGISLGEALSHLDSVRVDARWIHRLRQGGVPPWNNLTFNSKPEIGSVVRLVGPEGELIALASLDLLPGPADRPIEHACALRLERVI